MESETAFDHTPASAFVADDSEDEKKAAAAFFYIAQKNAFPNPDGQSPMYAPALLSDGGLDIVGKLLENLHRTGPVIENDAFRRMTRFQADEIPVFTAEHESKLLCGCHRFALPDGTLASMNKCAAGNTCMGLNPNIDGHEKSGGGVVLRALLTPEELTVFEMTGESPKEERLCILCARYHMAKAFFWCQECRDEKLIQNTIINWYVNPRDVAGGYIGDYMVPLSAYAGWRGMVGPVVCNSLHSLRLVKKSHVWWVDQSKLIWHEPTDRMPDEKARLFR
jgi:hypothetical protein